MICLYKCDSKSKKFGVLLVVSFIAGMCTMHLFNIRQKYSTMTFTKVARYQQNVHSEEENTSLQTRQEKLTYGKVIRGTEHVLLYNSVPKCGSRTFGTTSKMNFKKRSIHMNNYSLRKDNHKRDQIGIRSLVEAFKPPTFGHGHGYFEPFDKEPRPIYINFVRDPVSRMVSRFYFRRNGDLTGLHAEKKSNLIMNMDDCVFGPSDCIPTDVYVQIFCGFDKRCGHEKSDLNLTWALDRAKSNIDKYYTFIGITEEYEASLRVLEHLLPDLYTGVTDVYLDSLNDTDSKSSLSKTKNKQPLSQRANDSLTERYAADYQLYNYMYDKHRALKARFGIN